MGLSLFRRELLLHSWLFIVIRKVYPTPNPSPKEGRGRLAQEVLTWKYSNPSVKQPSTPGILLYVSHHLPSKERSQGWGCNFLCLWLLYAGFTPPHTPPQRGTGKSFGTWCLRVIAGKVSVAVGACLIRRVQKLTF